MYKVMYQCGSEALSKKSKTGENKSRSMPMVWEMVKLPANVEEMPCKHMTATCH